MLFFILIITPTKTICKNYFVWKFDKTTFFGGQQVAFLEQKYVGKGLFAKFYQSGRQGLVKARQLHYIYTCLCRSLQILTCSVGLGWYALLVQKCILQISFIKKNVFDSHFHKLMWCVLKGNMNLGLRR
jgi:hypothetical protein